VNVKDYTYTAGAVTKAFYMKYCKILNKVIQEAKKKSIIIDLQQNLILK
jgi:hypothetical protein